MTSVRVHTDLVFAPGLGLDLYVPETAEPCPTVLYLHGGGWQVGDKSDAAKERLEAMAGYGVAVASANYRFAPADVHPAQVHDAKAAVRWLRANGAAHGLSTGRIGVWGASAGAYLASLLALTPGDVELEGDRGDHLGVSSEVQAAVHWFGQSDLLRNARRSWLEREILPPPFEGPLLGVDDVAVVPELALAASPLHRVHPGAPPFLIAHGDADRVTPWSESSALHQALVGAGVASTLLLLGGAGHEGAEFDRPDHLALTAAFLRTHLLEEPA